MSTRTVREFQITLTIQAPFISHAVGAVALGWDTALHRDDQGRPALPGTLIKGNLREAWEAFVDQGCTLITDDELGNWLGDTAQSDFEPRRGNLNFDYWWCDAQWQGGDVSALYRIAIDETTGAVGRGAIQVIESPYPPGQEVVLQGCVRAWCDEGEADQLKECLQRGLESIDALGALKGIGFGRLLKVEVVAKTPPTPAALVWPQDDQKRAGLRLRLDRPLCFVRSITGERNRLVSEDFIPGAAIIGAIARALEQNQNRWPTIEKYLHELRCTHAFPVTPCSTRRPISPPLSLAVDDKGDLYDLALRAADESPLLDGKAPRFQPDWKAQVWEQVLRCCGQESPPRRLEVRTAIDTDRGTALEEQLFSLETVETGKHHWLAELDLNKIPKEKLEDFKFQLCEVLAWGLIGLGKTGACARIELESPGDLYHSQEDVLRDGLAIVTLLTPARLLPDVKSIPPTNGDKKLYEAYAEIWKRLSNDALELQDYFACQVLRGGRYWWERFGKSRGKTTETYYPEIHTEAGSVFVLKPKEGKEKDARKILKEWREHGLPQPDEADDWQKNPWIANNGYGEIAVNLTLHWRLAPGEQHNER